MDFVRMVGSSYDNGIELSLKNNVVGIMAKRKENGKVKTEQVFVKSCDSAMALLFIFLLYLAGLLFRMLVSKSQIYDILYHVPTVFCVIIYLSNIFTALNKKDMRMYHGAEHKVISWYNNCMKKGTDFNYDDILKHSVINKRCSINLISTFLFFELISSLVMIIFKYHINDIAIMTLPLFLYSVPPFNVFGLFGQLFTTKKPDKEHLEVAIKAVTPFVDMNRQ